MADETGYNVSPQTGFKKSIGREKIEETETNNAINLPIQTFNNAENLANEVDGVYLPSLEK